jgi:hypothetical protein
VRFDQICLENGIRHLLTAPYSPTTTGKVERLHKTMRAEFFRGADRRYSTIAELQAALDAWVSDYNTVRPHQGVGMRPPAERFGLAADRVTASGSAPAELPARPRRSARPAGVTRWVDPRGTIGVAGFRYRVGPTFAGEPVEVVAAGGLVEIRHRGVLVASHAQRQPAAAPTPPRIPAQRQARPASSGPTVQRIADGAGAVSFAGSMYQCGRAWARRTIEVSIVAGSVQLAADGKVIRVHAIRHDRTKEHGAFATPHGRPRRPKPVA